MTEQGLLVEESELGFVDLPQVTGAFLVMERLKCLFGASPFDQGGAGVFLVHALLGEGATFAVADALEVRAVGRESSKSEGAGGPGEGRGEMGFGETAFHLGESGLLGLARFDGLCELLAGAVGLVASQPEHARE